MPGPGNNLGPSWIRTIEPWHSDRQKRTHAHTRLAVALEEAQKASKARDTAACQCVTSLAGRRKNGAAGEIDVDDDVAADVAADVADELGQALAHMYMQMDLRVRTCVCAWC